MEDYLKCSKCLKTKPREDFNQRPDRKRGAYYNCKECYSSYYKTKSLNETWKKHRNEITNIGIKKRRAILYAIVLAHKNAPCTDCKIQYPPCVMDFDHIDPTNKKFEIAHAPHLKNEKILLEEIAKCELVCSNCHRLRTDIRRQNAKGRKEKLNLE